MTTEKDAFPTGENADERATEARIRIARNMF